MFNLSFTQLKNMAASIANKYISANEDCVTKISNCSAAMAHLTSGHVTLHYPAAASVPSMYVNKL